MQVYKSEATKIASVVTKWWQVVSNCFHLQGSVYGAQLKKKRFLLHMQTAQSYEHRLYLSILYF